MIRRMLPLLFPLFAACGPSDAPIRAPRLGGVSVLLASPIGYVQPGDKRVAWHPVPGSARYEVTISDSAEVPIFVAVTPDTQVIVPDSVRYDLMNNYRWYVTAYRDSDSTAWRSPVAIFRLAGEGRRLPPRPRD
jgi:hypothetical protein